MRAVLFDLDGTLLDTAPDMAGALNGLRREQNLHSLPFAEIRPQVSHGAATLVRLAFPESSAAAFETLRARFLDSYRARLALATRPSEAFFAALLNLHAAGIPW